MASRSGRADWAPGAVTASAAAALAQAAASPERSLLRERDRQRTIEGIAGADRVDGLDPGRRHDARSWRAIDHSNRAIPA